MDGRIARVLADVPAETLLTVAAGTLKLAVTRLDGPVDYTEIKKPHAEERTIAIVKASGRADGRNWSSVIKFVDLSIPGAERVAGLTWPEYEEVVYERRYFAGEGLSFRPANCYAVTRPEPELKLFWLEDLTPARGTPFALDQIAQMVRHVGEWNGAHAQALPQLDFPLGRDAYVRRVKGWNYPMRLATFNTQREHPLVRSAYPDISDDVLHRLVAMEDRLLDRCLGAPHSFAFGDCSAGNLFYMPTETIAIDWASLTDDPTGVDGGCLIGSSLSWGPDFMDAVRAEREQFEHYLAGLRAGGWRGNDLDARRAALAQITSYLMITSLTPSLLVTADDWTQTFLEGRYGLPKEEICARLAALVRTLPRYIDEIEGLLAR